MCRGTMRYVAFISLVVTIFQVKAAAWISSSKKSNIISPLRRQTQRYVSNAPINSLTHTGRTNDSTKDDKKKIGVLDGSTDPTKNYTTKDTQTNIHDNDDINIDTITSPYLVHKGRAVSMIKRCVSIEGLSIATGWTPQATEAFKVAIEALVRMNPILTGTLVEVKKQPWPWSQQSELWIHPYQFHPQSFVEEVDSSDVLSPTDVMSTQDTANKMFDYVINNVSPHILSSKAEFSYDQIKHGSPLFTAKIMDFKDGTAAFSIKMSHAVGDGTTYFELVAQVSSLMKGETPTSILWEYPLKSTHEIYPASFSERDYTRSYGLPFGWGVFKNIRTLFKRKCQYILLSKEKLSQKKKELRSRGGDSATISTNDIIMSSLCELCGSSDIFAFDQSIRGGGGGGAPKTAAGNLFTEVPFKREDGKNPAFIRQIVTNGGFFKSNEVPLEPFLDGRIGRITSLASVAHSTSFPGVDIICQCPSVSFIKDLPLDVAVIFRFNKELFGIMHNFRKINKSPLLDEIKA